MAGIRYGAFVVTTMKRMQHTYQSHRVECMHTSYILDSNTSLIHYQFFLTDCARVFCFSR